MATPAGCLMLAQARLRSTLADVAAFRTFAGAAGQVEALARIYHEKLPPPTNDKPKYTPAELAALRPYAVVATAQHQGIRKAHLSSGTAFDFEESGSLWLLLGQTPAAGQAEGEQDQLFANAVGQIIDGLCGLAGQAGYLAIEEITLLAIGRNLPEDAPGSGEEQLAILGIEWGSGRGGER